MNYSKEAVLDELTDFANRNPAHAPLLLDEFVAYDAKTGDTVFPWEKLRPLLSRKLELVMDEFHEASPTDDPPAMPNVEAFKYEEMKYGIFEATKRFDCAPLTIQRLCELVVDPWKHYNRTDKFMHAVEKNFLVLRTIEPRSFAQHASASVQGVGDGAVNGSFTGTTAVSPGRVNYKHGHAEEEGISAHMWLGHKQGHPSQ
ncbi:hypothetical protein HPB48_013918 [Haemaphysalis longicornis]|uniref:Uncharacterized protein n=1 Tax=Haemaphysalis longicornis TaxID=44386 RepID=A0A9J6G5E6_HAELO|nr:hypothetical protein HPB48_013918 [Haemaphysalis longicornis]